DLSTADHFADRWRMQDMEWRPGPPAAQAGMAIATVAVLAALLYAMGRDPICHCGVVEFWHGQVPTPESSQHLTDWWTFSHVIHGFLFYAALRWLAPRLETGWMFVFATIVEAGWEIVENSDWAIDRYRTQTVSEAYNGDSIL